MSTMIRRINESDIQALAAFEKEISIISFGNEAITDIDFHARRILKSLEQNADGMFVLAGGDDVYGWMWLDTKTNYLTRETYVNFRSFYITEEYRGSSESAALMEHGLAYCKKIKAKTVVGKVHINNTPMRALYKQFGFQATHLTMEYVFPEERQTNAADGGKREGLCERE